jgi:hypothetical protein
VAASLVLPAIAGAETSEPGRVGALRALVPARAGTRTRRRAGRGWRRAGLCLCGYSGLVALLGSCSGADGRKPIGPRGTTSCNAVSLKSSGRHTR